MAGHSARLPTVDPAGTTFDVDGIPLTDPVSHRQADSARAADLPTEDPRG